ncbi:MAG: DNA replication protein DnaC, partial [Dehalococcoidales bacterium]|nr:DNA replication protein DnaC [Dehalococcoidales bacterium]
MNKSTGTYSSAEEEETAPELACPKCKGAKFVHPLLASGKPDYGQVIPCYCTQQAADSDREAHLLRYSNL